MKEKILVLTSSYPKYKGDMNGNFIYEMVSSLKSNFDIQILAPSYKDSLFFECAEDIKIYRHKQFIAKNIELAYGSDILAKIRKNYLLLFVVPFYLLYQFLALKKIVERESIKIIHAHWLIPQGFLAVLYKVIFDKRVKVLVTVHGADVNSFDNLIGKWLKKFTLERIDGLTVVSHPLKEKIIALGYKREIFVYPVGIDSTLFNSDKRDETLRAKYQITSTFLLFVGGLIQRKGIWQLIQSMPAIIKELPDAKLLVIGDGNLKPELLVLVEKLNISSSVFFAGSISHDDLPPYFATADLFILPSFSEGWPVVVMEAMSSGATCLVSDIPVFKNSNLAGNLFFTFELSKPETLAERVIELVRRRNFETSNHVRQYAVENFDWSVISKKYTSLLKQL